MTAVRGGVKQHILWPAFDTAIQHRLQRFVMLVILAKVKSSQNRINRPRPRAECASNRCTEADLRGSIPQFSDHALPPDFGMNRLDQARISPSPARPKAARYWPASRARNAGCFPAMYRATGRRRSAGRCPPATPAPQAPAGRAPVCQTKASTVKSGAGSGAGASRSNASAIRSNGSLMHRRCPQPKCHRRASRFTGFLETG